MCVENGLGRLEGWGDASGQPLRIKYLYEHFKAKACKGKKIPDGIDKLKVAEPVPEGPPEHVRIAVSHFLKRLNLGQYSK